MLDVKPQAATVSSLTTSLTLAKGHVCAFCFCSRLAQFQADHGLGDRVEQPRMMASLQEN